jgi:hypothetical protein
MGLPRKYRLRYPSYAAMAERRNTDPFEDLIGQVAQDCEIDIVLSKPLGVLGHARRFEPVGNLLHRAAPADLTLSALNRQVRKISNIGHEIVAADGWRSCSSPPPQAGFQITPLILGRWGTSASVTHDDASY